MGTLWNWGRSPDRAPFLLAFLFLLVGVLLSLVGKETPAAIADAGDNQTQEAKTAPVADGQKQLPSLATLPPPPATSGDNVARAPIPVRSTNGGSQAPEAAVSAKNSQNGFFFEEHLPPIMQDPAPSPRRVPAKLAQKGPGGRNRLALIIDDLGHQVTISRAFVNLDADLTLAVLPGATFSRQIVNLAKAKGREIILHQPMEPVGFPRVDPGPGAMLSGMGPAKLQRVLRDNLARFPEVVGINNHMGSRLTRDRKAMAAVMEVLFQAHLFFIDSRTTEATVALKAARAQQVPSSRRDIFIDNIPEEDAILAQLDQLETRAHRYNSAIGIGHPYPQTLAALKKWLPAAKKRGIKIVRASRFLLPVFARNRYPAAPPPMQAVAQTAPVQPQPPAPPVPKTNPLALAPVTQRLHHPQSPES